MQGLLCMLCERHTRQRLSISGEFDGGLEPTVVQSINGTKHVGIAVRKKIGTIQHERDGDRLAGRAKPNGALVAFALFDKIGDAANGMIRCSHLFSPMVVLLVIAAGLCTVHSASGYMVSTAGLFR